MKWFKRIKELILKKTCVCCGETFAINHFYHDKSRVDGHKPRCKICEKLYNINRGNRRAYEKKYRQEHYEYRKAIVRKSIAKNKEHHKIVRQKYLKTEKGRLCYRKYTAKRYALRKNTIKITDIELMEVYERDNKRCVYCGKILDFNKVHFDHYIPLSKGGEHSKINLRTSCALCNWSKGSKMPEQWEAHYQMVQT